MPTYSEFLPSERAERDQVQEALRRYRCAEYRRGRDGQGMQKVLLWALAAIALFLLMVLSAGAQELPAAPGREPAPAGQYAESREFRIDTAALTVAWTLDTISTYQTPGLENGIFFRGSRSTAKPMAAWAAVGIGAAAISYEWKRHVHNRFLHPLWRVPLLIGAECHTRAAIGNWTLHAVQGDRGAAMPPRGVVGY